MSDADTGEFWGVFGGFAPLPRKTNKSESQSPDVIASKLFWYYFLAFTLLVCFFFFFHLHLMVTIFNYLLVS